MRLALRLNLQLRLLLWSLSQRSLRLDGSLKEKQLLRLVVRLLLPRSERLGLRLRLQLRSLRLLRCLHLVGLLEAKQILSMSLRPMLPWRQSVGLAFALGVRLLWWSLKLRSLRR